MKNLLAIAPIVFLAACDGGLNPPTAPRGPAVPPIQADSCNANQYAALIGQDATELEKILLLGEVRIIRPGQAVTMDFRPQRINFNIGSDNTIVAISCN